MLTKLHQGDYTRTGFKGAAPAVLSRIDRLRHSIRAGAAWPLEFCASVSDRAPTFVAISPGARYAASIPRWVAEHPAGDAIGDIPESWDAFERRFATRAAMHIVAQRIRRIEVDGEPSSSAALLWRLLRAMISLRAHNMDEERRSWRGAINALGWDVGWMSMVGCAELFGATLESARRLAQEHVVQGEREANSTGLPPEGRQWRLAKVWRRSTAWGRTRSRLLILGMLGADRELVIPDAQAAHALAAYWRSLFCATDVDDDAVDRLLEYVQPVTSHSLVDKLTWEAFGEVVRRSGNASSGPEGVPYDA